ncbi:MAG TPA: histidine--tRNA ligase [Patescibacteria group bacterium]|nr:histidine--tRNA ligase [Patescibacteria group bacterium]
MSNTTPQTLKGFRDFLPAEKRLRDRVTTKIKETFELYGFEPLETPTLEYASLLLGKYGDEADKLVYTFEDNGKRKVGLRYDQTVPTARVLAQYQNELPTMFRRYQIQNVFRADKPQKGRFREFTQCDIDIFGSSDPLADAEILACTYDAFKNVGFTKLVLKVNDRKTLIGTLEPFATQQVGVMSIIQSIDKLDKMSSDDVLTELVKKGLEKGKAEDALIAINKAKPSENLQQIMQLAEKLGVPKNVLEFSPALARGLDYYTGMIFEVMMPEFGLGSFGGGGRYDNLIQQLGGPVVPAIGIAFGFDRMVEAAKTLPLYASEKAGVQVMVTVFDASTAENAAEIVAAFRKSSINAELYPAYDKLGKQLKEASKRNVPYVVVIGPEEVEKNTVMLKNMKTGEQRATSIQEAIEIVKE